MLTITIYKPNPTNTLNAAGSGPPSPYTVQQLSAAAAAQEARTDDDKASAAANASAAAAIQAQQKLAYDIAHGAESGAILADTVSYLGDITITLGSTAVGYSAVPGAPESELFKLIGQATLATGEFATTVGSMASDYDGTQKLLANSPQLNAFISQSESAIDSIQSGLESLESAAADVSNTFRSTLDLALSSTASAVTSVSNVISDFGDANFPSLENTALTDLNASQVPLGNFANTIGMVIPNLTETLASVSSTDDTISIATGSAAPTSIVNFNPTKDGSATAVSFDTENTVNNTSQITTFNADGSSVTTFYSSPNGKGSVTEVDQENADGTSSITIYGSGGSTTTTNYTGPNGTGSVTKISIQSTTATIVSQTTGVTYGYTGHEIYSNTGAKPAEGIVAATATFAIAPGLTGSASPTAFSLTALGQTLTNTSPSAAAGAPTMFSFSNGQITQWSLEQISPNITIATLNYPSAGYGPSDAAGFSQNYAGPGALSAFNTNNPGTWSASSYQTTVTISPLAGQTQQLASVLSNSALTAEGAIQNITINGPGTVGVTGTVTVPAVGGQGTFTDNGTVNLSALGTNVLNLNGVTLAGSGFIQEQGENDAIDVSSVTGTTFQVTGGTLNLANPTGFGGTIGPASTTSGAAAMGAFGQVDVMNAMSVASGSFDTTTGMLSLLNSAGTDIGNIHFGGVATGLRLTQEPARGSSAAYLAINDQSTGGNIPLTFHA